MCIRDRGYRGIIFDIDNTLVTHGSPADERAIALFKHLKAVSYTHLQRAIKPLRGHLLALYRL